MQEVVECWHLLKHYQKGVWMETDFLGVEEVAVGLPHLNLQQLLSAGPVKQVSVFCPWGRSACPAVCPASFGPEVGAYSEAVSGAFSGAVSGEAWGHKGF